MNARDEERIGAAQTAALKRAEREAKLRRAVKLAADGFRPKEIAEAIGLTRQTVVDWLRARGVRYAIRSGSGPMGTLPAGAP